MNKFIVTEKSMRPASSDKQCFYCRRNIGAHHRDDCVLVKRDMNIRFSFELKIDLPAHWTNSCLCDIVEAEFVSQDQHEYLGES